MLRYFLFSFNRHWLYIIHSNVWLPSAALSLVAGIKLTPFKVLTSIYHIMTCILYSIWFFLQRINTRKVGPYLGIKFSKHFADFLKGNFVIHSFNLPIFPNKVVVFILTGSFWIHFCVQHISYEFICFLKYSDKYIVSLIK